MRSSSSFNDSRILLALGPRQKTFCHAASCHSLDAKLQSCFHRYHMKMTCERLVIVIASAGKEYLFVFNYMVQQIDLGQ